MDHPQTPIKVLYVDDDGVIAESCCELLNLRDGFQATPCKIPEKSIELAEDNHPDVVVTDIMMPGMSGFQVIDKIHEISPETKILVISAFLDTANEAQKHPIDAFYAKPLSCDQLEKVIRGVSAGLSQDEIGVPQ